MRVDGSALLALLALSAMLADPLEEEDFFVIEKSCQGSFQIGWQVESIRDLWQRQRF
jgi:hypothetical protein